MPNKDWLEYPDYMLRKLATQAVCCAGNRCCAVARLNGEVGPQCAFCSEVERWSQFMDHVFGRAPVNPGGYWWPLPRFA